MPTVSTAPTALAGAILDGRPSRKLAGSRAITRRTLEHALGELSEQDRKELAGGVAEREHAPGASPAVALLLLPVAVGAWFIFSGLALALVCGACALVYTSLLMRAMNEKSHRAEAEGRIDRDLERLLR